MKDASSGIGLERLEREPLFDVAAVKLDAFWVATGTVTAAVAGVLGWFLRTWPPHEDEALALFVGRGSLGHVLHTVVTERGGAPLHFLLSWLVVHLGGGLTALRLVSLVFAVASVPLIALLGSRLADPATGVVTSVLAGASWVFLFHGVFGRMYSLFLFTSLLSFLALLAALDAARPRRFALWGIAVLIACVIVVPALAFMLATLRSTTSPEARHLIFALPLYSLLLALPLVGFARLGLPAAAVAAVALVLIVVGEVRWAHEKTPQLFDGNPSSQVRARDAAAAWLASTARSDDVLLGYEPVFLRAWEENRSFSDHVLPRADPALFTDALKHVGLPLGRGVWVFDASDTTNAQQRQSIALVSPQPARAFEARVYGPYLVIRSRD